MIRKQFYSEEGGIPRMEAYRLWRNYGPDDFKKPIWEKQENVA
jgi:hypothetical protein